MDITNFLYSIIILLLSGIGYFVKRIFDRTDKIFDEMGMVARDVGEMKVKIKILWNTQFGNSASPFTLNARGKRILNESGIKEIVDANLNDLERNLRDRAPRNAYQLQEYAQRVIKIFAERPEILPALQNGAFNMGVDVDSILFVGSIYLRDLALPFFGF